jgi:Protein of unknown function (DUF3617)
MPKTRVWISLGLLALAVLAWAQAGRKPGLYEVTSTMTWQQSPMPPGMQAPPGSPFGGGPRTTQVCVTQAQIDKWGGAPPQSRGDCKVSDQVMKPNGMSGVYACTGAMAGNGTYDALWEGDGRYKVKVHFTGTMTMRQNSMPVEWTMESSGVYKGPDCGSVQPMATSGN